MQPSLWDTDETNDTWSWRRFVMVITITVLLLYSLFSGTVAPIAVVVVVVGV